MTLPDLNIPPLYIVYAVAAVFVGLLIYKHRFAMLVLGINAAGIWAWKSDRLPLEYLFYLLLISAVALTVKGMAGGRNNDVRRVMPVRIWVWHYLTGYPLDGKPRTNRTFLYRGRAPRPGYVKATWWGKQPGWIILCFRLGIPILLVLLVWSYFQFPGPWKGGMWLISDVFISYYVVRMFTYFQDRSFNRQWRDPLHAIVGQFFGYSTGSDSRQYMALPKDFRTNPEATIRLDVPMEWHVSDAAKTSLKRAICARLGMSNLDLVENLEGPEPHLLVKHAPEAPKEVRLFEVKNRLARTKSGTLIIGVGARRVLHTVDLDRESPHIGVSVGTGGGKSTLLMWLAAQVLYWGAMLAILDVKQVSQRWAKPLSDVDYHRRVPDIHDYLINLEREMNRRYDDINEMEADEEIKPEDFGPRLVVLIEEVNVLEPMLVKYWRDIRSPDDPKESPAFTALQNLLNMGRECGIHLIIVGQRLTARVVGGGTARDALYARLMGRFKASSWRMLCEGVPMPPATTRPGQLYLVLGDVAYPLQVPVLTNKEARELAEHGTATRAGYGPLELVPSVVQTPMNDEETNVTKETRLNLRHAIDTWFDEYPTVTYHALRQARLRDETFPKGERRGTIVHYTERELREWLLAKGRLDPEDETEAVVLPFTPKETSNGSVLDDGQSSLP